MEHKYDYKHHEYNSNMERTHKYLKAREAKTGWVIGGVFALAIALGITFYNHDNTHGPQDIEPAAGSSVEDTAPAPLMLH